MGEWTGTSIFWSSLLKQSREARCVRSPSPGDVRLSIGHGGQGQVLRARGRLAERVRAPSPQRQPVAHGVGWPGPLPAGRGGAGRGRAGRWAGDRGSSPAVEAPRAWSWHPEALPGVTGRRLLFRCSPRRLPGGVQVARGGPQGHGPLGFEHHPERGGPSVVTQEASAGVHHNPTPLGRSPAERGGALGAGTRACVREPRGALKPL